MNNYKANKTEKQASNTRSFINKVFDICGPSPATVSVLNTIFWYGNRHNTIHPSQETIANQSGISRRHVNRITTLLDQEGLIIKENRGLETCLYYINDKFNDLFVKRALRDLFTSLRDIPLKALLSIAICNGLVIKNENNFISEYVSLLDPSSLNIYINSPVTGSIVTVGTKKFPGGEYEGNQLVTNRKEVVMSELQSEYMKHIPKILHGIDNLNLAGKVRLSAFPESILQNALSRMTKKKELTHPFQFLFKVCMNMCQEANKEPDWGILDRLPTLDEKPSFILPFKGIAGEGLKRQPYKPFWTPGHNSYQPNKLGNGEIKKVKEYVAAPEWEAPKRKIETREEIDANIAKAKQSFGYAAAVKMLGQDLVNKIENNLYTNSGHVKLTPDSVPSIVPKKEEPVSGAIAADMEIHNIPLDKAGDDYDEVCDTGETYSFSESSPF